MPFLPTRASPGGGGSDALQALQNAFSRFLSYVPNVIGALLVLVIGDIIARLLRAGISRLLRRVHLRCTWHGAGMTHPSGDAERADAVVVGAGHNGLVAANLLADAGWRVHVLDAGAWPGGATRSAELAAPGWRTDLGSAFYPLGAASPVLGGLDLDTHGLRWCHPPQPLAHVLPDDRAAVISRDLDTTVASVERFAPGDGAAWRRLADQWQELREPLVGALLAPFPPVRGAARLVRTAGTPDLLRLVRRLVLPVLRFGQEEFDGEGARALVAGNAMHADVPPTGAGSTAFGWLLGHARPGRRVPRPRGRLGRAERRRWSPGSSPAAGGSTATGRWHG